MHHFPAGVICLDGHWSEDICERYIGIEVVYRRMMPGFWANEWDSI